MHNPLAPLIAIAQRGIPFTAPNAQAGASPFGAASAAVVAAGRQPTLTLFPSPGPWPPTPGSPIAQSLPLHASFLRPYPISGA